MFTVAFAGHREVYQSSVKERLDELLEKLAVEHKELQFYVGGMGEFDSLAASSVRMLKKRHPSKDIQLVLVEPYMKQSINRDKELLNRLYDTVLIPMELAEVHYKKAITERNRWMIDEADLLIAYVHRDFGGAYSSVKYARKQGKMVINVAE